MSGVVPIDDTPVFDRTSPDWTHSFLRLITLNIRCGRYSNLNVALRTMHQMRIDLGILTETKIDNDMYTRDCCGYTVFATHAKSQFQGGVALFYQTENSRWCVEGEMAHGPNVISCVLVSGDRRWNLLGVYIPPSEDDGETMNFVTEAIRYRGSRYPYILLGDLNVDLDRLEDIRGDTIAAHLALYDFKDVGDHFKHPRGRWTWSQQRGEHYVRSRTDYVLAQDVSDFRRWVIKIPRFDTDHRAIVTEITFGKLYIHRDLCELSTYPSSIPFSETFQ